MQNPAAALDVVVMFANELLALCTWLEVVGCDADAHLLRKHTYEAIATKMQ